MNRRPQRSTLFPDTTLFRSTATHRLVATRPAAGTPTARITASCRTARSVRRARFKPRNELRNAFVRLMRLALGGLRQREHARRSEEHTSELQSRQYLVCRLL